MATYNPNFENNRMNDPKFLLSQIFVLMNTWAKADTNRRNGELSLEDQVEMMTMVVRPTAMFWVGQQADITEAESTEVNAMVAEQLNAISLAELTRIMEGI